MAGHDCTVKAIKKVDGKETTVFTIKSSVLPSSSRLEVINQELPWMEEILFQLVSDERPVPGFTCIVRRFYVDLFQDLPSVPAPGQLSDNYAWVTGLGGRDDGPGWSKWVYFQLDAYDGWSGWLDVSVDSTRAISESNESNNIISKYIVVDCSNGS